jgi:biopolymer transport protein ExbD
MMDFRRGRKREDPEINLIPFIDVLLVVLIFLMVTPPTASSPSCRSPADRRRREGDRQALRDQRHRRRQGQLHGEQCAGVLPRRGRPGRRPEARRRTGPDGQPLANPAKDPVIIVNADQFAMHQMVINVLEAARMAGYDKLTFAAQSGGQK